MKLIFVKVLPHAKKNDILEQNGLLKVRLTAHAVDGKANKALIEALAGYFDVKKSSITIIKGLRSRKKLIEIQESL